MNYCEGFCRTIQRLSGYSGYVPILPPEYQQVEYIENDTKACIDTGITVSSTLKTSVKFSVASSLQYSTYARLFGGAYYNNTNISTNYFLAFMSATQARIPTINSVASVNISSVGNGIHTVECSSSSGLVLDDSFVTSYSYPKNASINCYLFAMNIYYQYAWDYYSAAGIRIHRATLSTTSDGTLYRDFIPCYRKSDNKPGMYDLVTNAFFTNAGTGEFILGNNV